MFVVVSVPAEEPDTVLQNVAGVGVTLAIALEESLWPDRKLSLYCGA